MNHKLQKKIELMLLTLLIILHITDFLEVLPGDLDFIKKLISWAALGYLFIRASLSEILFGHKKTKFDVVITLTYFLFIVKDLISYASVSVEEAVRLKGFYYFLLTYSNLLERYSFYLGGVILIFISLYMALKFKVKKPSFMATLHEIGKPPKEIKKLTLRFITVFLVLIAFFITIFNLLTEWLALALDSPIAIIGILIYLFIIIRYHKEFHPKHFIYRIGHFGEKFYEKFIKMFHYKKTLYLGIMGLLALHLLTDIGNFLIPYIIGIKDTLYFGQLGPGHTPLLNLLAQDISTIQGTEAAALLLIYLFNTIAMLFLLILPTFIWYRFFKTKTLQVSRTSLALVFSSLLSFALLPIFSIRKINMKGLVGVDIMTQSALKSTSIIDILIKNRITAVTVVAALALILGLIIWLLEFNKKIEKDVFIVAVLIGLTFFGFYISFYFISFYQYFINSIEALFKSSEFLIAFYFILFAMITIIFYIGGYLFFIYEVFKRHFFKTLG